MSSLGFRVMFGSAVVFIGSLVFNVLYNLIWRWRG